MRYCRIRSGRAREDLQGERGHDESGGAHGAGDAEEERYVSIWDTTLFLILNSYRKPLQFEKVCMQFLNIYKQQTCEVPDGLNFSVFLPVGQNFQIGGAWQLSNTKGAAFEITSAINN